MVIIKWQDISQNIPVLYIISLKASTEMKLNTAKTHNNELRQIITDAQKHNILIYTSLQQLPSML